MLKITSWLGFEAILGALKLDVHGCLHIYVLLFYSGMFNQLALPKELDFTKVLIGYPMSSVSYPERFWKGMIVGSVSFSMDKRGVDI